MTKTNIDDLVNRILNGDLDDFSDNSEKEEIMKVLVDKKVSKNTDKSFKLSEFGDKVADKVAKLVGSWTFIISFVAILILWIIANIMMLNRAFDPYPFILLNLFLSCTAALQAPIIMMSQRRQEMKDRARSENDYKVNLKSEIIIEDLHNKLEEILENQKEIIDRVESLEKLDM